MKYKNDTDHLIDVSKITFPKDSELNKVIHLYQYRASYQGEAKSNLRGVSMSDIGILFFTSGPKWIDYLFLIRNFFVRLIGLKGEVIDMAGRKFKRDSDLNINDEIGLFKVYYKSDNELIIGQNDKHLNFRVSLLKRVNDVDSSKECLRISTIVSFNNFFGRVYFFFIAPFHNLIVPMILKSIISNINYASCKYS